MFNERKYIKERAKDLPVRFCCINGSWKENGLGTLLIVKNMPSGNVVLGYFLIDLYARGVKDAYCRANFTESDLADLIEKFNAREQMINVDFAFANNLVFGAVDFADEFGYRPHKEFVLAQHMLDEAMIDDGIDEIEFGVDGKALLLHDLKEVNLEEDEEFNVPEGD